MKKIDWEEKYNILAEEFMKLQEENARLFQNYKPCVSNDNDTEIIKRLDIIGNMLGNYIKKQELEESKTKMNKVKDECEMLTFDFHSREMKYSNQYKDELKWNGDCEI